MSNNNNNNNFSRFKIIPVNNNYYKRGRWQVWDYYYYNDKIIENKILFTKNKENETIKQQQQLIIKNNLNEIKQLSSPSPLLNSSISIQNIPLISKEKLIPRRNSFQLITIKSFEDKNNIPCVPTSISEEHLNLIGINNNNKEKEENNLIKQQNSTEFITLPNFNKNQKPQSFEPKISSEMTKIPIQQQNNTLVSSSSSFTSTLLLPNKSITPPPSTQQMLIKQKQPIINLENNLNIELNNNKNNQQQQYFSASFGPGQIQFNNGIGDNSSISIINNNSIGGNNNLLEDKKKGIIARRGSSASTGAVPSQQNVDTGVTIDYKIEQAMDLVKTHLIYAVRDEIELLKKRIIELELNVNNLELENKILREHIPKEIIENIYSSLDNIPQQQQQQQINNNKQKILFSINNNNLTK